MTPKEKYRAWRKMYHQRFVNWAGARFGGVVMSALEMEKAGISVATHNIYIYETWPYTPHVSPFPMNVFFRDNKEGVLVVGNDRQWHAMDEGESKKLFLVKPIETGKSDILPLGGSLAPVVQLELI